jgi:hypothetical protein
MNTLTIHGICHDFATLDELRALIDPSITYLYRDGLILVGYDARPVMHVIGTTKEPVVFLGELPLRKLDKQETL